MPINNDKPRLWKADISASVDLYNAWFLEFAPKTYRETRLETVKVVAGSLALTRDHTLITPALLKEHPKVLSTLRMSSCPPLARDRLSGLAYVTKGLVQLLEQGKLPPRANADLDQSLVRMADIFAKLLDRDIFPWLEAKRAPTIEERYRASTIVADRLCGAVSDPIIRNAQEKRQLALIGTYLDSKGYKHKQHPPGLLIAKMEPGTYSFRTVLVVNDERKTRIPIDVMIQPKRPAKNGVPILIEAKSAGDFTNVNKRRKEEAKKIAQLYSTFGTDTRFLVFLCGYFDSGYLGYEAADGIDWIWEHRLDDFDQLGL